MDERLAVSLRPSVRWSLGIMSFAVVLALLYFGSAFLVPLAVAVLVVNLLMAVVERIEALELGAIKVPRWLALCAAVFVVLLAFVGVIEIVSSQIDEITAAGPRYLARIEDLVARLVALVGEDAANELKAAFGSIDLASQVSSAAGSAGSFFSALVLVFIYAGFMLADQGNLPKKFAVLFPKESDAAEARRILRSVSHGVRRYIGVKTLMSVLTGTVSYVILRAVGVDFAETWAILIFLLNYIPNIGSILGVVFPALLTLVQFDTFIPFLIIAAGLGFIQFFIGNVIEPALTGRSLNMSALMIMLSLTFWGALWGIMGMFLSVPIMVVTMIVCAHIPGWRWVAVLLSQDGRLDIDAPT